MALKEISYEVDWIFGTSVDELIEKLQELKIKHPEAKDIYLDEEWISYEDVEFHVCYEREETSEERLDRLRREESARIRAKEQAAEQERQAKIREAILKKEEELCALKSQCTSMSYWK